jgi:hypothetical protein
VELFAAYFERQGRTVVPAAAAGADWWDGERWNRELAADLEDFALTLTAKVGRAQAEALGFEPGEYDTERTLAFLAAVAQSRAELVNAATERQIAEALDGAEDTDRAAAAGAVFAAAVAQRAGAAGGALAVNLASFASVEAGRKLAGDALVKTWRTTSANPRAAHRAMNGETVPIGELFSNGLNWPGDPAEGADDVAGCECTVVISRADN